MKSNTNKLLALAITAGLGLSSFNAQATTSADTAALSFNTQGIATFSNSISAGYADFNDLFTFTTASSSGGASSVASFNGQYFSTAFSSFNLLNVSNGNSVVATGLIGPSFVTQLGFSGLNQNSIYALNIIGTVNSPSAGGFYSGSLSVSPIPEPAEYVLLAGGFGLIGFIANRRKQQHQLKAA
jgi:hypothetical protein